MDFKFFNRKESTAIINLSDYWEYQNNTMDIGGNNGRIFTLQQPTIQNCEFCFQFNDDEPVVFAHTRGNSCTIHLDATPNSNMIFNDGNGNVFKLFARESENGN